MSQNRAPAVAGAIKTVSLSRFRAEISQMRLSVQLGRKRLAVSYYGRIIGLLLPYDDQLRLKEEQLLEWGEMSLTKFRDELTEAWEKLHGETGGMWLTFHTRRIAVFVSPNEAERLGLIPEFAQEVKDFSAIQEAGSR
jgi:hypothetical protein